MGLFDFGSGDPTGGLYGSALTPEQQQAVSGRGLLGFLAGMQKSGALDYTVPFISGKVPGGLAAGLAGGLGGMGSAQDEAVKNALNAKLLGLQGQNLEATIAMNKGIMSDSSMLNELAQKLGFLPGGGTASPAAAGAADTVEPPATPAALVKHFESGGNYNAGTGGADLSKAPKDENGFPIWEGHDGSHAAGAYQFQPATWAQYAKPLGIKDFSPESQDAVFRAAYLDQGYKPWAPFNPRLAAAVGGGGTAPRAPAAAQLASLNAAAPMNDATPAAADMSAIPRAPGGTMLPVPSMPQMAQAAPAGGPPMATGGAMTPDASKMQQFLSLLGAKDAGVNALTGRNPYQSWIGVLQGSPTYKAAVAAKTKAAELGAALPFAGPTAAATKAGEMAGALPYVGPTEAAKEGEMIRISRSGAITKGGQYIGHVPLETTVTDAQGNRYTAFTPPMGSAAGTPEGAAGNAPHAAAPAAPGAAGVTLPPGAVMGAPSELGPGQKAALETRGKEEQVQRQKVIDEGNAAQQSRATLMNMANEAGSFKQGPFAQHYQSAARYLRLIDPSYDGQVASYEDFVKNAGALTRQAVHEVSSKAAVQEFNQIAASLPNPEMSEIGLRRVQNEMIGLTDFRQAKVQAQHQWEQAHGGPGNVTGFETAFQKQASPYAFIVARMDPADRKEMIAKLQGNQDGQRELSRLGEQLTYLKQSGLAQ